MQRKCSKQRTGAKARKTMAWRVRRLDREVTQIRAAIREMVSAGERQAAQVAAAGERFQQLLARWETEGVGSAVSPEV